MTDKKIIELDLSDCKYLGEMHERIRKAFNFPEWYGANLSAFEDLISSDFSGDEIIILGSKSLKSDLQDTFSKIISVLDSNIEKRISLSALHNHIKSFTYRIES